MQNRRPDLFIVKSNLSLLDCILAVELITLRDAFMFKTCYRMLVKRIDDYTVIGCAIHQGPAWPRLNIILNTC